MNWEGFYETSVWTPVYFCNCASMRRRREKYGELTFSAFDPSSFKLVAKESSMDGEQGFLHAFGICQLYLKIIGLWPESKSSKLDEVISLFLFVLSTSTIVVFVNVAQTFKLLKIWGDLDRMSDILSTADLPIGVAVFKMLMLCHHKEGPLITYVRTDWGKLKTSEELANMWSNARISRKMSLLCVNLGLITVNVHLVVRVCQELNIFPGKSDEPQGYLDAYFPYDIQPSPAYEITFAMQWAGAMLATVALSACSCVFMALMLHLCGQFANLRLKLESLENREKEGEEFRARLAEIVERHKSLNSVAKVIESVFNLMFLAEILSCSIQFCLQGFLLVTLSIKDGASVPVMHLLFLAVYLLHLGTHLFILCYVAEKLQAESFSIFRAAYNCKWYSLAPKDTTLLLIVMNRAKLPLQVTAGKFCIFSLNLFAQICKTSAGYLSMLLAVRDRIS